MYLCEPDAELASRAWPRGRGRVELLAATGQRWLERAEGQGTASDGGAAR
jgi:hypothetical protein